MADYAICLVNTHWDATQETLASLEFSMQANYDVLIVNNTNSADDEDSIRSWVQRGTRRVRNVYFTENLPLSVAWNLALINALDYEWVVKMDSGILWKDAPRAQPRKKRASTDRAYYRPPDYLAKGEVAGFVTGASAARPRVRRNRIDPRMFLDSLSAYSDENRIGVCAIPTIPQGWGLKRFFEAASQKQRNGSPYLLPGCMAISNRAFRNLGYFDERLNAELDTEYSLRAVNARINIGYHPGMWCIRSAEYSDTDNPMDHQNALYFIDQGALEGPVESMWLPLKDRLRSVSRNNVFVTLKNLDTEELWDKTRPNLAEA